MEPNVLMRRPLSHDELLKTGVTVTGADLTTLKIGGEVRRLLEPRSERGLVSVMRGLRSEGSGFLVIGGGSNVLMSDDTLETPLILTTGVDGTSIWDDGSDIFVSCGAGVRLRDVFAMTLRDGLSGMEFAVGIPGTVGGAVMGNAGTPRGEIGSVVHSVRTVSYDGRVVDFDGGTIEWGYRTCGLRNEVPMVVSNVVFRLRRSTRESVLEDVAKSVFDRKNQPSGRLTAGCVFRNPPGESAGRMLELAGCKRLAIGGAAVSEIHANFIENTGGATASDFASLALRCREKVMERFGVRLRFEITALGISLDN
ncbi:MAG: UDP-N-acetylmuramate dehydrogenase [Synergistaceae bacterium]|jgi:UDP-N-acetylmuramate dehydrogenase|nr:UDP-N-acetylmuramate dehydrogenase [Synergistaceae bacterium]